MLRPSFASWGGPQREGGTPIQERFTYSSDVARQLDVDETRVLLSDLGFIGRPE